MLSGTSAATQHLHYHDMDNVLNEPETEHNWAAKEAAIKSLGNACHSGIAHNPEYIAFIKNHRKAFNEALLTERTRLSGTACEMVEKLSTAMGRDFSVHFPDLFTGALLKVCARTNKVMVTRAVKALSSMVNVGCIPCLPKSCQAFATNNKVLRIACIGIIASCIAQFTSYELEPHLAAFEPVLKEGVSDAAPEVRDTSRKSFKVYAEKFPERSQLLTATLPGNVLKYLLPDARSSAPSPRASAPTSASRHASASSRFVDPSDLTRHQSSRELSVGLNRTGPSRVGPVRSRTMATTEHSSTSFKAPALPVHHSSSSSHSNQGYSHHSTPLHASQGHLSHTPTSQHHSAQSLTRTHGHATRTTSMSDASDNSSHSAFRVSAQRSRTLNSTSLSGGMVQRAPSINLATNGGPQRAVSGGHFSADAPLKLSRSNTVSSTRLSKAAEPISKPNRMSMLSTHTNSNINTPTPTEREPGMSASERAKAYSATLKTEMASRRAAETHMRMGLTARRVTTDHAGYSGYTSMSSVSAGSNASTASTSTANSTTSISPASSTSTSPTTVHSPNHDQLFSTFRGPTSSHAASSPSESCPSPEARHLTPSMSQPTDDQTISTASDSPFSPTFMAQVSLDPSNTEMEDARSSNTDMEDANTPKPMSLESSVAPSEVSKVDEAIELSTAAPALVPTSPRHNASTSLGADIPQDSRSPFAPPEDAKADIGNINVVDDDTDHNMSIPDHESLFGNTENYLQAEKEISELQRKVEEVDPNEYMDEDSQMMEHEEQQATKTFTSDNASTTTTTEVPSSSSS